MVFGSLLALLFTYPDLPLASEEFCQPSLRGPWPIRVRSSANFSSDIFQSLLAIIYTDKGMEGVRMFVSGLFSFIRRCWSGSKTRVLLRFLARAQMIRLQDKDATIVSSSRLFRATCLACPGSSMLHAFGFSWPHLAWPCLDPPGSCWPGPQSSRDQVDEGQDFARKENKQLQEQPGLHQTGDRNGVTRCITPY